MTVDATGKRLPSTCPHDCPSVCALEVEILDNGRIGRVYGSDKQSYTDGIICAKVARYAERANHKDRLLYPMKRTGPKGSGAFVRISWEEALDTIAARFLQIEAEFGSQAIWPHYYAGTMGRVMRDGIHCLTHTKKYSRFHESICINMAWSGFIAGTGKIAGVDPREIAHSDCIVIWGTNAVATQVNFMSHAIKARKSRGAKIIAIDVYQNATMKQADMALCLRPGTDAALACATMHVLFRDGLADHAYMNQYCDDPTGLEESLRDKTPEWAAAITGLTVEEIEAFALCVGRTKSTYFRLGYGFSRQRNGAVGMHAALSIPAVTGAWQHKGGGAFHSNSGIFHLDQSLLEGRDACDLSIRELEQTRIGEILCGNAEALCHGPPVKALFIQNTNPMSVSPDQNRVREGFAREDLFTVVHEQFMTDTAKMADIVLPATMFFEHDDFYTAGGHQHLSLGLKLTEPPGECRNNHDVIAALASRLGAEHKAFTMTPRALIDATLEASGWGGLDHMIADNFMDVQPDFASAHYLNGFHWPDGKYRFRPDWAQLPFGGDTRLGPWQIMPAWPDYWPVHESATRQYPFQLTTSPSHSFLNSSFNQTSSSLTREGRPNVLVHPDDAAELGIMEGDYVALQSARGTVHLHARLFAGVQRKVLICEGIWPNHAYADGQGINTLTGADIVAPSGGAAVHDNRVAMRKASADASP